jgi:uncharacterized protein YjbK
MPYPPQGYAPIAKTILEKSPDEIAAIFESVTDVDYLAAFTNGALPPSTSASIFNGTKLSADKAALIFNNLNLSVSKVALIFDNANLTASKAAMILNSNNIPVSRCASILNDTGLSASKAASILDNANLSVGKLADIFGHINLSDSRVTSIFNLMTRATSDLASVFNDADVPASRAAYVTQNTSKDAATLALIFNDQNLSASKAAAIFNDANLTASRIASILNSDNMSASKAALIFDNAGLSASKAASVLDDLNLSADKARQIFIDPNLSDSRASSIYDSMTNGAKRAACVGTFEKSFSKWTYVVINAAGGYAWQQVTDYVYEGAYSARMYGYSHYTYGRDHRSKAYITGKGVASKRIRVKSYEVSVRSDSYGASYGIYAKFGSYAIYWIIAYSTAATVPDLATYVASRNASVTAIGDWKEAVTDVTIASAFSEAGYPVPTDNDTVEIGVACRAHDGPGVCMIGMIDVRFDLFEVI